MEIANLLAVPTRDMSAINAAGQSSQGWDLARPRLREVIATADHLLAAWDVGGLSGRASAYRRQQLRFVASTAQDAGRVHIWTLNGEPRHPSRWYQYVSDRHGGASGTSLTERLAMVLMSVPVETLCSVTCVREVTWCPSQHSAITPSAVRRALAKRLAAPASWRTHSKADCSDPSTGQFWVTIRILRRRTLSGRRTLISTVMGEVSAVGIDRVGRRCQ
jgi:hypothetical protein